jgi:hypothetical protein
MSVDPLAAHYPFTSPYAFALNKPIMLIDVDGREIFPSNHYKNSVYGRIHAQITSDDVKYKIGNSLLKPFCSGGSDLYLRFHSFTEDDNTKGYGKRKISEKIGGVTSDGWAGSHKNSQLVSMNAEALTKHKDFEKDDDSFKLNQNGELNARDLSEIGMVNNYYHELMHAQAKGSVVRHNILATEANRNLMVNALLEYANNNKNIKLSPAEAKRLAWNGLQGSDQWKALSDAEQKKILSLNDKLLYGPSYSQDKSIDNARVGQDHMSTESPIQTKTP